MEVQEVKETRAQKRTAKQAPIPRGIQELIDIGIPVRFAVFKRTVISVDKTPETGFYSPEKNLKPSKTANMWYTPHGLVTEQRGTYKIIPLANVTDTIVT